MYTIKSKMISSKVAQKSAKIISGALTFRKHFSYIKNLKKNYELCEYVIIETLLLRQIPHRQGSPRIDFKEYLFHKDKHCNYLIQESISLLDTSCLG